MFIKSFQVLCVVFFCNYLLTQVMIDYLYGKFPTLRGAEEICEIFEIVDLADRFKVCSCCKTYTLLDLEKCFVHIHPERYRVLFIGPRSPGPIYVSGSLSQTDLRF